MSKAASKSVIEQLHDAVATHLISLLTNANAICSECKRSTVDPRVLASAIKFVKENGVEADPGESTDAVGFRPRVSADDDDRSLEEENNDPV